MEKLATEEAVWTVCAQLVSENRKVTGRSVQKEIGGSLSTILKYIATWKTRDGARPQVTSEFPVGVQKSIVEALDQRERQATAEMQVELAEASERESEIMEALSESETRINRLEMELTDAQDKITAHQQARDKEAAVAIARITGLEEQINRLVNERNDCATSANTSKTELVKAQIHLEHSVQRAVRAEDKIVALDHHVAELIQSKSEAENQLAVSALHAKDLSEMITSLTGQLNSVSTKLNDADAVITGLTHDLNVAVANQSNAEILVEQMSIRLQDSAITIEHLRNEQVATRVEAAHVAELLALYISENDRVVNLKPPLALVPDDHESIDVVAQGEMPIQAIDMKMVELRKNIAAHKKQKYSDPAAGITRTTS